MVKINWLESARNDLKEIHEYIAIDSLRYADVQIERIFERIEIIKTQPKSGKIIAYLDINEEGELIESRITRGIGGGCDEAALRIIRNSTFTPAKDENANPVSARHYIERIFKL